MCLSPSKVPDVGFVACRKCWQCRERRIDDWVGRNIAESRTATAGHVVTLTYGNNPRLGTIDNLLRAAVLTYSDVQKMLKHLRADGYPVRYFAVGEYGSKKGRAHWHIILYWQDKAPEVDLRQNIHWKYWQHGWSYWDRMTPEAVRYACKYLLKSTDDEAAQAFGPMPSKKPPLGDAYFRDLAQQYVDAGLAPQDLFYSFPDVRRVPRHTTATTVKRFRDAAKPIQFLMSGKTAENFCRYFVEGWRKKYNDEPPRSEPIWNYLENELGGSSREQNVPYHLLKRPEIYPHDLPADGSGITWDATINCHVKTIGGDKFYLREIAGVRQWQKSLSVPWDVLHPQPEQGARY